MVWGAAALLVLQAWTFVWILTTGAQQTSQEFRSHTDCESARLEVIITEKSPQGKPIESTKDCVRVR